MKWLERWQQHKWWWLGSSALFWLTTLPWISQTPFNWDSAQFELGVQHFSIAMHQPHPPGYPLYIASGWLLAQVVSVHLALSIVTILFAWGTSLVLYWIVWRMFGHRWLAGTVTVLFIVNPMFWFYRELNMTYTVDVFASILLGGLTVLSQHTLLSDQRRRYLYISSAVLAIAAGFRPSLAVLLGGLILWQWWLVRRQPASWSLYLISLGIIVGLVLTWFVPLIWLTGWQEYWSTSFTLYGSAAAATSWLAGASWYSGSMQLYYGLAVLAAATNALAVVFVAAAAVYGTQIIQRQRRLNWGYIGLSLAWFAPSMIIYGFVHFGQNGYILTVLPPLYLALAGIIWWTWRYSIERWARVGAGLVISAVTVIGLSQIIIFTLFSPVYFHPDYQPLRRIDMILQWLAQRNPILFKINHTLISATDRRNTSLQSLIKQYPTEQILVIAPSDFSYQASTSNERVANSNIFRELAVLLPDYLIADLPTTPTSAHTAQHYQRTTITGRVVTVPDATRYVMITADQIDPKQLPKGLLLEQRFTDSGVSYYYGIMNSEFSWLGYTVRHEHL